MTEDADNHESVVELFKREFGQRPLVVESPGRVNLIGEHTDYNGGFALPAAIDKGITLAVAPNGSGRIRLLSVDKGGDRHEVSLGAELRKSGLGWPDYILGVIDQLRRRGCQLEGVDVAFGGDIPIGAGLSSSAALEGAVVFGLNELFDLGLSRLEMAKIGQLAENNFVGVACGILDQFANLHGKADHVIKLDCRSLEHGQIPFEHDDLRIVLFDTNVRRELAASEYNLRRRECGQGVSILKQFNPTVETLRDVSEDLLETHGDQLPGKVQDRCRYVVEENRRVEDACHRLKEGDFPGFGKLMMSSHRGLRDLYEVSCPELDVLVEATVDLEGVLGARMMGGGFGGCTINLVLLDRIEPVVRTVQTRYEKKFGKVPNHHVVKIGPGVRGRANP